MHRRYLQENNDTCNRGQTQNVTFAESGFTDQVDQVLFGIQQAKMAHCATTDFVSMVA